MTKDQLLKILETEIVGDGQGSPDYSELVAAADRIWPEIEKLHNEIKRLTDKLTEEVQ